MALNKRLAIRVTYPGGNVGNFGAALQKAMKVEKPSNIKGTDSKRFFTVNNNTGR